MRSDPDVLILGGGPAGAAAAIHLARAGRSVALIEQTSTAHDKVCGEFLSREAIAHLHQLGVDLCALGAVPIHAVRLAAKREIAACELPFPAMSLSRRVLDEALLALAAQSGVLVLRGNRVDSLRLLDAAYTARLSNGTEHRAANVFLATGKHDVAGHRRPIGVQNDLVALKMYFQLAAAQQRALDGFVELFLFAGGYAGLQLAEKNRANLCFVVTRATLRNCGNHWPALRDHLFSSSALLAERLEAAMPLLPKPLALSSIPYGMLRRDAIPNLWHIGDQAAVIPSFSGDGISIALQSAYDAANFYLRDASSADFAKQESRMLRTSVGLATAVSRLIVAAPVLGYAAGMFPALVTLLAKRTRIPTYAWPGQSTHVMG